MDDESKGEALKEKEECPNCTPEYKCLEHGGYSNCECGWCVDPTTWKNED